MSAGTVHHSCRLDATMSSWLGVLLAHKSMLRSTFVNSIAVSFHVHTILDGLQDSLVYGQGSSFAATRQKCRLKGGDIASVHDAETNSFIVRGEVVAKIRQHERKYLRNLIVLGRFANLDFNDGYWIGLTRTNGTWQWTDGSPVDFTKWHVLMIPPSDAGKHACAYISKQNYTDNDWLSAPCDQLNVWVAACQADPYSEHNKLLI